MFNKYGDKFEYRLTKRTSYCRVCDRENVRDKDMVMYTYSSRNRGQNILICPNCLKEMYKTIIKFEEE